MLARLIARVLEPRSYCMKCERPFFSDKRRPCPSCGTTARRFVRSAADGMTTHDKAS